MRGLRNPRQAGASSLPEGRLGGHSGLDHAARDTRAPLEAAGCLALDWPDLIAQCERSSALRGYILARLPSWSALERAQHICRAITVRLAAEEILR